MILSIHSSHHPLRLSTNGATLHWRAAGPHNQLTLAEIHTSSLQQIWPFGYVKGVSTIVFLLRDASQHDPKIIANQLINLKLPNVPTYRGTNLHLAV